MCDPTGAIENEVHALVADLQRKGLIE